MKRRAQPWLGCLVDITIADSLHEAQLNASFEQAFAAVALVHRLMSFHDPASDVARINRALPGALLAIHAHTYTVLEAAQSLAVASAGIFDIGCAAKLVEWSYLPALDGAGAIPPYRPGQTALSLQPRQCVKKTADGWIDLGGIAKGYAVDLAVAALRSGGVRSACVNAGGDLRVFGPHAYPVAIRDPACPTRIARQLQVRDQALATSGSYFSKKEIGAGAVSALLDGRSGEPIRGAASASVCAPTCMMADALTKLVLACGDATHPVLPQFAATAFII